MKKTESIGRLRKVIFIVTDTCMWEMQKQSGGRAPHAIEVVDEKTGKVRFIRTGARIRFIDGDITPELTQKGYNTLSSPQPRRKRKPQHPQ